MLQKLHKKALLIGKLYKIGADFPSSCNLVFQLLFLSVGRYVGLHARPFSSSVHVEGRRNRMYFAGTMGELLTLADIFANNNYVQKHNLDVPVRTVLDLGANMGIATVWLALTYPDAKVHAYEPNPAMYALLVKNVQGLNRVSAYQAAIAGEEGTLTFNQSIYSLESSLFEARQSKAISVTAHTLDHAISTIGGFVDYMKIDIEGAEFDALKTCTQLDKIRTIVGEAHTEQAGHTQEELMELLSSFNVIEIYNPANYTVFGFRAARITSK